MSVALTDPRGGAEIAGDRKGWDHVWPRDAAAGALKGILGAPDEPPVSSDFRGDTRSSTVDLPSNMALGGNLVKGIARSDNEWGYSCRCADLIAMIAAKLPAGAVA